MNHALGGYMCAQSGKNVLLRLTSRDSNVLKYMY